MSTKRCDDCDCDPCECTDRRLGPTPPEDEPGPYEPGIDHEEGSDAYET